MLEEYAGVSRETRQYFRSHSFGDGSRRLYAICTAWPSGHAIGHVDDEGNLASIDQEIESELSLKKGKSALGAVADDSFVQLNMQLPWAA